MNDYSGYCDDCKWKLTYYGQDPGCSPEHRRYKTTEIPPPPALPTFDVDWLQQKVKILEETNDTLQREIKFLEDVIQIAAASTYFAKQKNAEGMIREWKADAGYEPAVKWARQIVEEAKQELETPTIS